MARPHALAALPDGAEFGQVEQRDSRPAPQNLHELQAAVEGAPVGDRIQFMGQSYKVADKVGATPYMQYCWAVKQGLNVEDVDGMAAVYAMLRDCFVIAGSCGICKACENREPCPVEDLGDWPRFESDAIRKKAEAEDLMEAITQAIKLITARPTRRPSDSSAGPSTTSPSSTGSSPSPDTRTGQVTEKLYTVDDLIKQAGA